MPGRLKLRLTLRAEALEEALPAATACTACRAALPAGARAWRMAAYAPPGRGRAGRFCAVPGVLCPACAARVTAGCVEA